MKTIFNRIKTWFDAPHTLSLDIRTIVTLLIVLTLLSGVGIGWLMLEENTLLDEWLRGMYLASRLDAIAGQGDTTAIDHSASDTFEWWGMETNSKWLAEYTAKILPFFEYEGIGGGGEFPKAVAFVPFAETTAFVVGGRALRDTEIVLLNSRYVLIPTWGDDAEILAVLVHELTHLQRGNFIGDNPAEFEAFTEAATAEILAAMCNYGDTLACRAFASAMKSNVVSVLRRDMNLSDSDNLYQIWADLALRHTGMSNALTGHGAFLRLWLNGSTDIGWQRLTTGEVP